MGVLRYGRGVREQNDHLIGKPLLVYSVVYILVFIPGYECHSPVAPGEFDRLVSGYRVTQTVLWGDPCYYD